MDFNPAIFLQLLERDLNVSTDDFFRSDMTLKQAAALSLSRSIMKKFIPKSSKDLAQIAIQSFVDSNTKCRLFEFRDDQPRYADILKLAKAKLQSYFHSGELQESVLSLNRCLDRARMGPGASLLADGKDFITKTFLGPLAVTDYGLYSHYVTSVSPRWRKAELFRLRQFGLALAEGSRLSTVAKNAKTDRTVCTEPALNMFYQLGAGELITDLLQKYHNICIKRSSRGVVQKEVNMAMARRGSEDGSLATIDLSNASDRISLKLLEALLPRDVMALLMLLRSPCTEINHVSVPLHMMSSMGNGFTFPLMTLVFATLVRACYEYMGIKPCMHGNNRNYSVFGDDIICETQAYHVVCGLLEYCGLEVNMDKSYSSGPFRESCGGDFFKGYDIRGVYLKRLSIHAHAYSLFNRLCRWSARHSVDLSRTLLYVKGLSAWRPVPLHSGDTEGHIVPKCFADVFYNRYGIARYSALSPQPRRRRINKGLLRDSPDAHLTAVLHGSLSSSGVVIEPVLQGSDPRYKVVVRHTPCWDYVVHPGLATRDYEYLFMVMDLYE